MTILTANTANNSTIFPDVLKLYTKQGQRILDMTYGKGIFWRKVDTSKYNLVTNDWITEADMSEDFRRMSLEAATFDCVILDPPYMHDSATVKASINDIYLNNNGNHESVIRLYAGGILEAARLLKKRGILIVKSQDEIESGVQRMSHIELIQLAEILGFRVLDLFIVVSTTIPAMQWSSQKTARKNHSYFIVLELRK